MAVGQWVRAALVAGGPSTSSDGHSNKLVYDPVQDLALIYDNAQDTWSWDGSTWTQLATAPNAGTPVLCYDGARQEIMMFDGAPASSSTFNKTRIWDWGTNSWTLLTPATSPSSRLAPGIAFDAANSEVVMFGGATTTVATSGLDETWVWDGTTWTQQSPATVPTRRSQFSMAYDPVRGEVVMFGGRSNLNAYLSDTVVWDGTDWTVLSPATSPSAREQHGMCWDPFLQAVVLYGGSSAADPFLNDTWTWDGTDWTDITSVVNDPTLPPPENRYLALTYFTSRDEVTQITALIAGGLTDGDTWVLHHTYEQSVQVMRWW